MILASQTPHHLLKYIKQLQHIRYSTTNGSRPTDILLYTNQSRPKFVLFISAAAGIQLLFWSYLSYSALNDYYEEIRVAERRLNEGGNSKKHKDVEERVQVLQSKSSLKWRVGFSLLALSIGAFFGLTALMYPRRMVNKLMFDSQSSILTISTNSSTGAIHLSKVSIFDIQSTVASPKSSHYAIKVKGHHLFYLLDKKGDFPNLRLFDTLIGIR